MTKDEILKYLKSDDTQELFKRADEVRKQYVGDQVHLRGLIEFSNYCHRNCQYCGIQVDNKEIGRYRMSLGEIFDTAKRAAKELNYKTVVLQSGEDPAYAIDELAELAKKIKGELGIAITMCIGELEYDQYVQLRRAGVDRYLLRFETSDKDLYEKLHPGFSLDDRIQRLRWLKEIGFQTGSGNLVGLPGQTLEILADDIFLMKELELDMIGLGPFIPHPKTLLKKDPAGTLKLTLKVLACARIVTKNTHMPATTAMGSIDPTGRQQALQCGANIMMPNVTPTKYREFYELYPDKICINDQPQDCSVCIGGMLALLGRQVSQDFGHSLKI